MIPPWEVLVAFQPITILTHVSLRITFKPTINHSDAGKCDFDDQLC
jgi:hypothetical protein